MNPQAALEDAGMTSTAAAAKRDLFDDLHQSRPGPASHAFFVPGRIEVLGKHTDYAGGRSLLCTLERGIVIVARPRSDNRLQVTDVLRNESRDLLLTADLAATRGDWLNYVATVARRVAQNFPNARRGADIVFASDLHADSGMSSSSALIVATFLTLSAVNELSRSEERRV